MQFPPDPVLCTERLELRPMRTGDDGLLWPDIADGEIARHMAWEPHTHPAQTTAFVAHEVARLAAGRGCTWTILQDGGFRGIVSLIGLQGTHRALTYNRAELAYWLGRAHHRQGLATEAVGRVMQFAFHEVGLHKLHVSHFATNLASRGLIRRLGFRYVGEQRQEFRKAGTWYDHQLYELLAHEFFAVTPSRQG